MSETEGNFDEIWDFVEEKFKSKMPPYIKYILHYCGYNNGISIATIKEDDIEHFINEVRKENVTNYFKYLIGDTNVLEGSTKDIKQFEFCRGHLKYLMSVVEFLKKYAEENGPDSFTNTKQKKKSKSNKPELKKSIVLKRRNKCTEKNENLVLSSGIVNDVKKQKNILIKKMLGSLTSHTPRLYAEKICKIKEKVSSGQLIIVNADKPEDRNTESETCESSDYTGSMFCQYCLKKINVFYVSGQSQAGRWNSSNFDRHLKLTHSETANGESGNAAQNEFDDQSTDAENKDVKTADAASIEKSLNYATAVTIDGNQNATNVAPLVTEVIDIDSNDNSSSSIQNPKPVGAFETDVIDLACKDNGSILIPVIPFGGKSKNIVCYTDSDDSDYDVDGHTQDKNPPRPYDYKLSKNLQAKQSKIPVSKANVERIFDSVQSSSISKVRTNQPSTSRQVLGQMKNNNKRMGLETDSEKERVSKWNKYF